MRFYANQGIAPGEGPERVILEVLANGDLVERTRPAIPQSDGTYAWPGPDATRVLARGLTANAVFTFFTYRQTNAPCGVQLGAGGGNLTATDLRRIDTVGYRLNLREASNFDNPEVGLTGLVRLANLPTLGRLQDPLAWQANPVYC